MPAITAAFAGVAYLIGFFNMLTMILPALIVAIFTPVQFVLTLPGPAERLVGLVNAACSAW